MYTYPKLRFWLLAKRQIKFAKTKFLTNEKNSANAIIYCTNNGSAVGKKQN